MMKYRSKAVPIATKLYIQHSANASVTTGALAARPTQRTDVNVLVLRVATDAASGDVWTHAWTHSLLVRDQTDGFAPADNSHTYI